MEDQNVKSRPGEKALEALKMLDKDLALFKAPKGRAVKKKRPKVKILDEDTYIEEMAKIIQRDFFPDLEKLQAQNEFLDATERKDHHKLRELFIKYSGHRPPTERYASPATFETPRSEGAATPSGPPADHYLSTRGAPQDGGTPASTGDKEKTNIKKYSLDSYLASHTSEDNSSFQELMEEMGRRSRAKFAGQLQEEHDSLLRIQAACQLNSQQGDREKPLELDTWSYKAKNYIMYVPEGQPVVGSAGRERQQVVHSNTRMEAEPFDYQRSKETIQQIAKSQERILSGRIGVDGSTLLDARSSSSLVSSTGGLAPALPGAPRMLPLARTPSPHPGAPGESPLMTWGEIEGSPFRLDGGDTPLPGKSSGASFKMALVPKREQLALALAEKAGQRHRALKQKAMEAAKRNILSPSPRLGTGSAADRLASMSPAARRLATHHLLRHTPSTPRTTPLSRRNPAPLSNSRPSSKVATPRTPRTPGRAEDKKTKNNLTDNLLQINLPKRRLKASDFFS